MRPEQRRGAILAGTLALAAVGSAGYWAGQRNAPSGGAPAPSASAKALYWYDPMVPNQHFDHPGKSPFMDMQLVPKLPEAGGATVPPGVRVDGAVVQNLGIRTAEVRRGALADSLVTTGIVQFNERSLAIMQPRAAGFVQRVYARAPGDVIAAGAPLVDLLIPEWGGAQAEFLAVSRTGDPALTAAARERLRLLGMTAGQVASVERGGRVQSVVTVSAPLGGVIQKLDVRQGMTVTAGQSLAEINGLGTVWVVAAVPETQAGQVRSGQFAKVTFDAFPGETFRGRVQTVLPQVAGESRTLQARIELPNPGGRLRPGLFAQVAFGGGAGSTALLAPSEALIRTGRRTIVMLARPNGRFEPVEVQTGRESGDRTEILAGLNEGDRVVASGQFLIDSEASLSGLNARPLSATPAVPSPPPQAPRAPPPAASVSPAQKGPPLAVTQGRVESVTAGAITISHQPVASIGWPAMTMTFHVADPKLTRGLKPGDQLRFGFDQPPTGPTLRMVDKPGAAR